MSNVSSLTSSDRTPSMVGWVESAGPCVGRIFLALLFILSGVEKLAAPTATIGYIQSAGLPFPGLALGLAATIEIGCGAALVFGFQTRWVALIMTGFTLATAFAFHANFADQNQMIHFFKNVSIAGGLLQVAGFGGGRFSIDRLLRG